MKTFSRPSRRDGSGVGGARLVAGRLRRLRHLRALNADIPADEVADHRRAVALSDEGAESCPQVVIDPDGAVSRVGVFHEVNGRRCIYRAAQRKVAVYIHTRYRRGYPRQGQVAWQIGVYPSATGGLFRMPKNVAHPGMVRTLPAHETCQQHKYYALTCDQYEALIAEAGNSCQVCGLPGPENSMGKLFIDHACLGNWAVRGLLCNRCNTILGKDNEVPRNEHFARYLANAWYLRQFAHENGKVVAPPEPPEGSRVRDHRGRIWQRQGDRWRPERDGRLSSRSWRELVMRSGPAALTQVWTDMLTLRLDAPELIAQELVEHMRPDLVKELLALLEQRLAKAKGESSP